MAVWPCAVVRTGSRAEEAAAPSLPALRTLPSGLLGGPHVAGEPFEPEGSQLAVCLRGPSWPSRTYKGVSPGGGGGAAGEAAWLKSAEPFKAKMLLTTENVFTFTLREGCFGLLPPEPARFAGNLSCVFPQELRKPSYAEICQRTNREPPSSPLQPPKEQKPNTVSCGKEEKKLAEREPPAPKSNPGPPRDQKRPLGRRPSPPAAGRRPHREQSTPPRSPQ